MTSSNFQKVKEFHEVMGMTVGQWPCSKPERGLRKDLIYEECEEAIDQMYTMPLDRTKIAKELADLLYVTYGTAVSFGIDIDKVFAEVHKSNMSKLEDGKPVKREDGKVLKGKNYAPPNLEQLEFVFK